jgi:hypothetical protein
MSPGNLNSLIARERRGELLRSVARRRERSGDTPVTRVTLRWAAAADSEGLRRLAELDSASPPHGVALVAEVDGRLRAALPLDGSEPIADPHHRGAELVELLRVRAAQLARV